MISGTGRNRLATINGETFAAGETHKVTADKTKIAVTCLEIRERTVLATVLGVSGPLELKFGKAVSLEASR